MRPIFKKNLVRKIIFQLSAQFMHKKRHPGRYCQGLLVIKDKKYIFTNI